HPEHHELVVAVVDDLVLDVVAQEAGGAGHQRVLGALDEDPALPPEADLELDLIAVRVLAHAAAGRNGLVAHREPVKARPVRGERGIGVTVRRNRLPERRPGAGLHHDGVSADALRCGHRSLLVENRRLGAPVYRAAAGEESAAAAPRIAGTERARPCKLCGTWRPCLPTCT